MPSSSSPAALQTSANSQVRQKHASLDFVLRYVAALLAAALSADERELAVRVLETNGCSRVPPRRLNRALTEGYQPL
jgi:hypothetical protein